MENDKIIIIALIVIIAILCAGMAAMMMPNFNKENADLKITSASSLKEGDSLKIKLTDANGGAISNQNVNITITDENQSTDYHSVVTDANGVGNLKLDKSPGKYDITVAYGGNDKYNGCNDTKKITIKEKEEEQQETSSSSSSGPSAYAYKSDGTPMYSQAEVDRYMYNKYGSVNYHLQDNGYVNLDEPGFDDAGHYVGR
ncbi:carboxypeptidase-like regulatory domain-containing protein [Methanobrevibacter sp.]|uniref:carboxypeptidase-like regulatory domain-containing protein n=1 Tax=Methanobrevibacter sp. TaxID=66852 RepID=UPI00388EC087